MSDLNHVVDELQRALNEIDSKLAWDDLPMAGLEEFKAALDNVRTSLLALIGATDSSDYQRSLRRLRLHRAAQVCHNVLSSVVDGTVGPATPGITEFKTTVVETLDQVDRLIGR
jgi:hypothetical protein